MQYIDSAATTRYCGPVLGCTCNLQCTITTDTILFLSQVTTARLLPVHINLHVLAEGYRSLHCLSRTKTRVPVHGRRLPSVLSHPVQLTTKRSAVIDKQKVEVEGGSQDATFTWHQNRRAADWHLPSLWHDPIIRLSRLVSLPRPNRQHLLRQRSRARRASLPPSQVSQRHPGAAPHTAPHRTAPHPPLSAVLSHRSQSPDQTTSTQQRSDSKESDRTPFPTGPYDTPRTIDRPRSRSVVVHGRSIYDCTTSFYPASCYLPIRTDSLSTSSSPGQFATMAEDSFIGLPMLVTMRNPPARLRGTVSEVQAGHGLTLTNGSSSPFPFLFFCARLANVDISLSLEPRHQPVGA